MFAYICVYNNTKTQIMYSIKNIITGFVFFTTNDQDQLNLLIEDFDEDFKIVKN